MQNDIHYSTQSDKVQSTEKLSFTCNFIHDNTMLIDESVKGLNFELEFGRKTLGTGYMSHSFDNERGLRDQLIWMGIQFLKLNLNPLFEEILLMSLIG